MKRVAVVGAGAGGTLLANVLANSLSKKISGGEVSVHLFGEGDDHFFQPASLDIAFRGADPMGAVRKETSLLKEGVIYDGDGVARVDMKSKTLTTRKDSILSYDYIVFATGAVADPGIMPGLSEGSLNFHTGPRNASKIWETLQTLRSGTVAIAITSVPHKCPPSPDEAAFLLDEFLRKRGLRESVSIKFLTPYPRAYPAEQVSKVVERLFEERDIKLVPFFAAHHVDPAARKIYNLEDESEDYDLLIAVPPHRGARVVSDSRIGDEEGWIPADKHTMRIDGHPEAYAIGDGTNISISKSGVVAHLQAETVAKSLIAEIRGRPQTFEYNGRINCPMETGRRRALFVAGTYDGPPQEQRPTLLRYAMKREFANIYWSTIQGGWSWLMDAYFGETSEPHQVSEPPQRVS
jgi:sulfide:quinone oxidoreductase